jgi:hypothetical protein
MIFSEYAVPIPGKACSWSDEAEFRSTRSEALVVAAAAAFFASFPGAAFWAGAESENASNRIIRYLTIFIYPL